MSSNRAVLVVDGSLSRWVRLLFVVRDVEVVSSGLGLFWGRRGEFESVGGEGLLLELEWRSSIGLEVVCFDIEEVSGIEVGDLPSLSFLVEDVQADFAPI